MLRNNKYKKLLLKQVKKTPVIFWDTSEKQLNNLSEEALLERILNYGDINQLRKIVENQEKFKEIYQNIRNKERRNLNPQIVNYIDLYLAKNASRDIK